MPEFSYEYTDTFAGEANYCWVKRGAVSVPELTHYGYDGLIGYSKASARQLKEVVRLVKRELGLTGVRCKRESFGCDAVTLYPCNSATVIFITFDAES